MKCSITRRFDFKRDKVNVSELCRQCGISRTHFYAIINDQKEPTVGVAIKITQYLNAVLSEQGYGGHVYDVEDLWHLE